MDTNKNNNVLQQTLIKMLTDIHKEVSKINKDVELIKQDIKLLKDEHNKVMNAFPHGTDQHRNDHQKKGFFGLFK